jgi:hypothetical protein
MAALTLDALLRLRAVAQGFTSGARDFTEVTRASGGLQSQDATAGLLSARVRTDGLTLEATRRARIEDRTVVRTWAMRGTLHFLAADDLGWLLPLFGPLYEARDRTRLEQLGVDAAAVDRGVRVIRDLLAERGPTTREPIRAALAAAGLPHEGQALVHLLYVAALRGTVCCSDDRGGGTYEFALLDDWVERGPELPRPAALEELARRYLQMAGPATVDDFAAWSGLPARDAREGWAALRDDRIEVATAAGPMNVHRDWEPERGRRLPIVRLLPRFDTYLLSYRSRDLMLAPEHTRRVFPGGGILHPTVLVDGRLVGVWRLDRTRKEASVVVQPFEPLAAHVRDAIEVDAADVGRFLGITTATAVEESTT